MNVPVTVYYPPFHITRVSHTVLGVRDLKASKDFYAQVWPRRDGGTRGRLYLRGVEEVCHHSLVLRRTEGEARCERIGLRVLTEDELDKASVHFHRLGLQPAWTDAHGQGRTLQVRDRFGVPWSSARA